MLTRILLLVICVCGVLPTARGDEVDDLLAQLKSPDREVRYVTVRRLGRLRAGAAVAIPELIDRLADQGSALPTMFGSDLGFMGPRVRDAAAQALARIGPPSVEPLRNALSHPNKDIRQHAAAALEQMGPIARPAFSELSAALQDPVESVRWRAIWAIARIGEDPAKVVPLLSQIAGNMDEERNSERQIALSMLGPADPGGDLVIPILQQALQRDDPEDVNAALTAVQSLGPQASLLIPRLTELLRSQSVHWDAYFDLGFQVPLRGSVARTLGIIGPPGESAAPQLLLMMDMDEEATVRWAAAAAIVRISPRHADADRARKLVLASDYSDAIINLDPQSAVAYFLRVLQEPDPDEDRDRHWSAVRELGALGPRSGPAVPRLIEILDSDPPGLLENAAIHTLGQIGPAASAAVPALHRAHARLASDIGDVDAIKESLWQIQAGPIVIPSVE